MLKSPTPKASPSSHRSHLFTVRLWWEDLGGGRSELRGRVQHTLSRETRYFRDWQTLTAFLVEQLEKRSGSGGEECRSVDLQIL